jgi:hypothetical protein
MRTVGEYHRSADSNGLKTRTFSGADVHATDEYTSVRGVRGDCATKDRPLDEVRAELGISPLPSLAKAS